MYITNAWNYRLGILGNKYQAKLAKDLDYQFVLLVEEIKDDYQILSNLIKST